MTRTVIADVSMHGDDQSIRSRHAARSLLDCVDLCLEDNTCHSAFYCGDSSHKHSESNGLEKTGSKSLHHWYICRGRSKMSPTFSNSKGSWHQLTALAVV